MSRPILVTGASGGSGAAVARAAADRGHDVALGYLDHPEGAAAVTSEIELSGRRAVAIRADLKDGDAARRLVAESEEELGPLYGIVNNAGIMPETPFLEIRPSEWEEVIATDLTALYHTCQAVLPGMLERGEGVIVNISSRLGQIGCAGVVHYAAAKAGVLGFTKSLSREFGPRGIRGNAVAPGVTLTEMSTKVATGAEGARRLAELPSGRFAEPEDVAAAVVFLLSDEAAMFHGQALHPNGGGFMP